MQNVYDENIVMILAIALFVLWTIVACLTSKTRRGYRNLYVAERRKPSGEYRAALPIVRCGECSK